MMWLWTMQLCRERQWREGGAKKGENRFNCQLKGSFKDQDCMSPLSPRMKTVAADDTAQAVFSPRSKLRGCMRTRALLSSQFIQQSDRLAHE